MTMWWVIIIGSVAVAAGLLAVAMRGHRANRSGDKSQAAKAQHAANAAGTDKGADTADRGRYAAAAVVAASAQKVVREDFVRQAEEDVEHIFNDQFREELRNRGRLHFEKIIGENAMFLQQDLRLTTSQLNDYMKQEISSKLKEEFTKYEQSIMDAKQMAIDSIEKTKLAVEENRVQLLDQLHQEFAEEKAREIKRFDENMTDVVNHYLIAAIGDQIDLSDQLEYIIANLEANKQAIIQDLANGT